MSGVLTFLNIRLFFASPALMQSLSLTMNSVQVKAGVGNSGN
jgi:hypothetical protein